MNNFNYFTFLEDGSFLVDCIFIFDMNLLRSKSRSVSILSGVLGGLSGAMEMLNIYVTLIVIYSCFFILSIAILCLITTFTIMPIKITKFQITYEQFHQDVPVVHYMNPLVFLWYSSENMIH
jgi:phage shock protein PspC (stress-responsive transcriptional regulator)